MSRIQKTLTICLWVITVSMMVGLIALWPRDPSAHGGPTAMNIQTLTPTGSTASNGAASSGENVAGNLGVNDSAGTPAPTNIAALPVLWQAPAFSLTDQDNQPFTLDDLHGHPFICDFIYTQCPAACPVMTATLSRLQKQLSPDVKLVSFSVDPTNDTPAVFKKYAADCQAEPGRWHFLTGKASDIFKVGFGMHVMSPNTTVSPLQHNTHFFLVDGAGKVREMADLSYPDEIKTMVQDANALASASGAANSNGAAPASSGATTPANFNAAVPANTNGAVPANGSAQP